jgi:hypothetical protein
MQTERRTKMNSAGAKRSTFMHDLDRWTIEVIVEPLLQAYELGNRSSDQEADTHNHLFQAVRNVQTAIRNKMLANFGYQLAKNVTVVPEEAPVAVNNRKHSQKKDVANGRHSQRRGAKCSPSTFTAGTGEASQLPSLRQK